MTNGMLYSGGADSLAIWYMTGKPKGVYVMINSPYEKYEIRAIKKQMKALPELEVEFISATGAGALEAFDGRIPLRNTLLIVSVLSVYDFDNLFVGFLRGEASTDKSKRFVRKVNAVLKQSESRRIKVKAVAHNYTKTDLLKWLKQNHPDAPLHLTLSCYGTDGTPCHNCPSCFRADVAKFASGWSDVVPTVPERRGNPFDAIRKADITQLIPMAINNWQAYRALKGKR